MAKKEKRSLKKNLTSVTQSSTSVQKVNLWFPTGFWRQHVWAGLILLVLPFLLYFKSLSFGYVLDDVIVYTENSYVKEGFSGIGKIFTTESFQGYFGEQKDLVEGGRYRPLSIASFAVEFGIFGQRPAISHFINILLYALTCVLLYRVLFLFFPLKKETKWNWLWSIPFIGALLFTLHPIHTEVVANVKGRDEIICLLASLGVIYFAFKYVASNKVIWTIMSALCLLIGLFGKENAITFIGVVPLSLYFFTKADFKKITIATLPLIGVFVLWFIIRWQVLGFAITSGREVTDLMNNPFTGMETGEKFATIFYTLGIYVKLLFFPHPLTHDYYPYHIPIMQWGDWQVLLSLFTYIVLGAISIWGLMRKNVFAYAILFYLFTLSITSNVPFTVGTFMNERFVYISSIGVCIALAYLMYNQIPKLLKSPIGTYIGISLVVLYSLGFTVKTVSRVPAWESALTLNSAAIKVSKNSARANTFMGTALFKEYQKEQDRERKEELINQAATYIFRALEIHPYYGSALTMKSGILAEQYKFNRDLDRLLNGFYEVLSIRTQDDYIDQYMTYLNGGRADVSTLINWYYKTGTMLADNKGRRDMAAKYFRMGLEVAPNNPQLNAALQRVQ